MRKIKYNLDIGFCGCNDEGEMEIPDDYGIPEIDTMVNDMAQEWAQSWEGDSRLGWDEEMSEEETEEYTENFYANVDGSWEFMEEDDGD